MGQSLVGFVQLSLRGWPFYVSFFSAWGASMHTYFCYGLYVQSEFEIPEFLPSQGEHCDVRVRYGDVSALATSDDRPGTFALKKTSDVIHLWMNDVGGMKAHQGRCLVVDPAEGAEQKGFRFLVAGIGMGFLLHQQGVPSLHGSAVAFNGGAVAFVGPKGMGKSTTAGVFHGEGYPVLTDDVLPIYFEEGAAYVAPSFPHLKLYPDSLEAALGDLPQSCRRIDPGSEKRGRTVDEGFPRHNLPLRCIYLLDWSDRGDHQIASISGRDACIELLRHSFALRMFEQDGATDDTLGQISRLASKVPVRRLNRPHDLDSAQDLPAVVGRDLERLVSAS